MKIIQNSGVRRRVLTDGIKGNFGWVLEWEHGVGGCEGMKKDGSVAMVDLYFVSNYGGLGKKDIR